MPAIKPGQIVTWSLPGKHAPTLTGLVIGNGDAGKILVLSHGDTFEVAPERLRTVPVCPCGNPLKRADAQYCSRLCAADARKGALPPCGQCGKPCKRADAQYCSRECYNAVRLGQSDDEVFAYLVEYKGRHDGASPTIRRIATAIYLGEQPVMDAIDRLRAAGRIWIEGGRVHRRIGVVGGRWVYQGAD